MCDWQHKKYKQQSRCKAQTKLKHSISQSVLVALKFFSYFLIFFVYLMYGQMSMHKHQHQHQHTHTHPNKQTKEEKKMKQNTLPKLNRFIECDGNNGRMYLVMVTDINDMKPTRYVANLR